MSQGLNRTADENSAGPGGLTNKQVLLGLFIVGQIVFLLTGNLFSALTDAGENIPEEYRHPIIERLSLDLTRGRGALNDIDGLLTRWAELTGQDQHWCLFAPAVWKDSLFVAVKFRRNGRTDLLLSDNEPRDRDHYLRRGGFRMRKYENTLELLLERKPGETEAQARRRWRGAIRDHLRGKWERIQTFLQWRWRACQTAHPDRPRPTQLILVVRRYHINSPDQNPWTWQGPFQVPLARWRPDLPEDPKYLPLEAYDPVAEHFERLERQE